MVRLRYATLLVLVACGLAGCSAYSSNMEVLDLQLRHDSVRACELTRSGVRAYRKGDIERAEAYFKRAIAADETYGPAHNNLGSLYLDQRDLYQAAWAFQRAAEFMPERAEPFNNLGLTYETAGRLEDAIDMFSSAVELEPANPEYLGNLMRARVLHGDRDDSTVMGLQELLFIDQRPEWIEWAEDQLALNLRKQSSQRDSKTEASQPAGEPELLPPAPGTGASVLKRRTPDIIKVPPIFEQGSGDGRVQIQDAPQEVIR